MHGIVRRDVLLVCLGDSTHSNGRPRHPRPGPLEDYASAIVAHAVGVLHRSPGSQRSRAPWVRFKKQSFTPKALHNQSGTSRLFNAFGVNGVVNHEPRVRPSASSGRPWATV